MTTLTASFDSPRNNRMPREMELVMLVRDAEVIEDLAPICDLDERHDVALTALRVGVLALRKARGEIDAQRIRHEGERIVGDMREAMVEHTQATAMLLGDCLRKYLDPESGALPARLERLVSNDGELVTVLRDVLAGPDSELSRVLAAQVGVDSPVMRLLDPAQAASIDKRIRDLIETGVADQKARVLAEFSLDNKQSALARLLAELTDSNGRLRKEFGDDLCKVTAQFSLDDKNSALSRLVERVNVTQDVLLNEFSLDGEHSALARLKREINGHIEGLVKGQADFQAEVRDTLARLEARKRADQSSPQHGDDFEVALARLVRREAERAGDVFEPVGAIVGGIKHCKKGDFVMAMGPEHAHAGRRIVIEAKASAGYSDRQAIVELEEAKRNRGADVGVFVFARRSAGDREAFRRIGDDVLVVWDEEDPSTNIYLHAAISVARALIFKKSRPEKMDEVDVEAMEASISEIEKQMEKLDTIHCAGESIRKQVDNIQAATRKMRDALTRQIGSLREHVETVAEVLAEVE